MIEYVASSLYSYRVGSQDYKGSKVSIWVVVASYNARFLLQKKLDLVERVGDTGVVVYYNPKKPAKSVLLKPGLLGLA